MRGNIDVFALRAPFLLIGLIGCYHEGFTLARGCLPERVPGFWGTAARGRGRTHDARPAHAAPDNQADRPASLAAASPATHKYPGRVKTKRPRHRRWRLSSLHCFHRLKADRFQLCVAQLAAVDLHESNATWSLAKINKTVANL